MANQMEGDSSSLLATTCNNLGCYYKKVGKFHGALSYLRRALKLEAGDVDADFKEVSSHESMPFHGLSPPFSSSNRLKQAQFIAKSPFFSMILSGGALHRRGDPCGDSPQPLRRALEVGEA